MRLLTRKLTLSEYDENQWREEVIDILLPDKEGKEQLRQSEVLVSARASEGQFVEFEFNSSVLRPTEIHIPLIVSSPALVELFVNDEDAGSFSLTTSDKAKPHINHLRKDVTQWSESHGKSRLKLRISYYGLDGKTTILLDNEQPDSEPVVYQRWSWSYAARPLIFFFLAYGCVMGLIIIAVAHIKAGGDTLRFFAVLGVAATWLASLLGIPNLKNLPLQSVLRWLNNKVSSRAVSLALLSAVFIVIAAWATTVVYCLRTRYRYSTLINQAINTGSDEALRKAFILLPWRKEAQFLFESHAFQSGGSRASFRAHVQGFVNDPEVKRAVEEANARAQLPYCLTDDAVSVVNDPVIWYASILPEGEEPPSNDLTQRAISNLRSRKSTNPADDTEAKLQLIVTEMNIERPFDEQRKLAAELDALIHEIENTDSRVVTSKHAYQVACDSLAQFYINECELAADSRDAQEKAAGKAAERFVKLLEIRQLMTTGQNEESLWHRPPGKFLLYYMFLGQNTRTATDTERKYAEALLNKCEPFKMNYWPKMLQDFSKYNEKPEWYKGFILNDKNKLNPYLILQLDKGWSY